MRAQSNFNEPMLPLFDQRTRIAEPGIKRRLFLIPSHFDETFDPNFSPIPTPQEELPEITAWVRDFTRRLLEVMSSRRSPHQLARWCHRNPFATLQKMTRSFTELPKVRRVHIRQPLESLAEVTIIIEYRSRIEAVALRFEGVDRRWLCTVIERV
ncbi:MAG: Rv3235 family protein [Candidatus Nanopelagicaceae bacterium]|jgi:hypothetical protein